MFYNELTEFHKLAIKRIILMIWRTETLRIEKYRELRCFHLVWAVVVGTRRDSRPYIIVWVEVSLAPSGRKISPNVVLVVFPRKVRSFFWRDDRSLCAQERICCGLVDIARRPPSGADAIP